jgi:hypothetical protein
MLDADDCRTTEANSSDAVGSVHTCVTTGFGQRQFSALKALVDAGVYLSGNAASARRLKPYKGPVGPV